MYAAQWAFKSGWIVVQVPSCFDLTQKPSVANREHFTGLYCQYDFAKVNKIALTIMNSYLTPIKISFKNN